MWRSHDCSPAPILANLITMAEDSDSASGLDQTMETLKGQNIKSDEKWINGDVGDEHFTVLDPEDPSMKKFQEALKSHLTRLDNQLADEIYDLVYL